MKNCKGEKLVLCVNSGFGMKVIAMKILKKIIDLYILIDKFRFHRIVIILFVFLWKLKNYYEYFEIIELFQF